MPSFIFKEFEWEALNLRERKKVNKTKSIGTEN